MDGGAAVAVAGREDEFLAVHLPFLKATPHTEGDDRFIFCEASNQSYDQESDEILKSALEGSSGYYQENGNVDVDHLTILGYRIGLRNPHLYEIGRPAEVRFAGKSTLVKAKLYRGEGPAAEMANYVWSTFALDPPMRWFPSVGGDKRGVKKIVDPATGLHKSVVTKVLWKNLALSKQPQNLSVPAVSTIGFDEFAKGVLLAGANVDDGPCLGTCCKAITALPSPTDVGQRTGGAALAPQSLHGARRFDNDPQLRDVQYVKAAAAYVKGLGSNACEHTNRKPSLQAIVDHFETCGGMDASAARHAATRLLRQISDQQTRRAA